MHVDGFRFDLASELGREKENFQNTAAFFDAVSQDPLLSQVKLIAEPWDLGTYQAGNFPVDWCEWNGRYRDVLRKFIKGDAGQLGEAAARIFGSQDIFGRSGRTYFNSVNFITCHDGFTLNDLVSYNAKHNEANKDNNCDGANDNNSWNCGVEGPTKDHDINKLRKQQIKNFAACLLLSGGTPMILGGDEFGRTQQGNNNTYCQDNELSWFNWNLLDENHDIFRFFSQLIKLMLRLRSARNENIQYGNLLPPQVKWFGPDLKPPAWHNPEKRTLCVLLPSSETGELGKDFFVIINSDHREQQVKLPPAGKHKLWHLFLNTAQPSPHDIADQGKELILRPQDRYHAHGRSVVLLAGK